jgi:4-aminobutyrate aminotransferase
MGSLSLTGSKYTQKKRFFPLMPGVHHIPYPDCYRCPHRKTPRATAVDYRADYGAETAPERGVEYSTECPAECGTAWTDAITDTLFRTVLPPDEVAAIVVEPIQGEGGYLVPPKEFLQSLRRIADENGILLVFDEVQSGMGRTGKMFAFEHFGVVPDIICLAKGIASGMPLSATVARADVMDWSPGTHASTFGGNPVALAAALATLELLESELTQNAAKIGEYIMTRLRDFPTRFKSVGDVRGRGLMIGIELVKDQKTKERAPELRDKVVQECFERGLLILGAGPNTIRLCPPLVIDKEQADFAVDTIAACLS